MTTVNPSNYAFREISGEEFEVHAIPRLAECQNEFEFENGPPCAWPARETLRDAIPMGEMWTLTDGDKNLGITRIVDNEVLYFVPWEAYQSESARELLSRGLSHIRQKGWDYAVVRFEVDNACHQLLRDEGLLLGPWESHPYGFRGRDAYIVWPSDAAYAPNGEPTILTMRFAPERRIYDETIAIAKECVVHAIREPSGRVSLKDPLPFWPKEISSTGHFSLEVLEGDQRIQFGKNHYDEISGNGAIRRYGSLILIHHVNPQNEQF